MRSLKSALLRKFPRLFSIVDITRKLLALKFAQLLSANNSYLIADDLIKIKTRKNADSVYIFGSGASVDELTDEYYNIASNQISFACGRWYVRDFVPDILYIEFDNREKKIWIDIFAKGLSSRALDYSSSLIVVEVPPRDLRVLSEEFLGKINPILRNNIRFVSSTTAIGCRHYFGYIHRSAMVRFFIRKFAILPHCRSSSSIGLSIASILKISRVFVAGVDGYNGYFANKNSTDFDDALSDPKNSGELHGTANPIYGIPTIIDCFCSCSDIFDIQVSSEWTLLSEMLVKEK